MSSPRVIVVGDVHGCDRALERVLDLSGLRGEDHLVFVGDLIDRGPESRQVIERILRLRSGGLVSVVRGNHEEMFLDALRGGTWAEAWWNHGGPEMLDSYGCGLHEIPAEHVALLETSLAWLELPSHIVSHAALSPALPLDQQTARELRWQRIDPSAPPHLSGKTIVCGHTPQKNRQPHVHFGWIGLDTWVYDRSGCLTALDLNSGTIYQASQWEDWSDVRSLPALQPAS